jgi:hypothetical protein
MTEVTVPQIVGGKENEMSVEVTDIDVTTEVLNALVFGILNPGPYVPSEDTINAIDLFGERVKEGLAGVMVGLLEVASAIRDNENS